MMGEMYTLQATVIFVLVILGGVFCGPVGEIDNEGEGDIKKVFKLLQDLPPVTEDSKMTINSRHFLPYPHKNYVSSKWKPGHNHQEDYFDYFDKKGHLDYENTQDQETKNEKPFKNDFDYADTSSDDDNGKDDDQNVLFTMNNRHYGFAGDHRHRGFGFGHDHTYGGYHHNHHGHYHHDSTRPCMPFPPPHRRRHPPPPEWFTPATSTRTSTTTSTSTYSIDPRRPSGMITVPTSSMAPMIDIRFDRNDAIVFPE